MRVVDFHEELLTAPTLWVTPSTGTRTGQRGIQNSRYLFESDYTTRSTHRIGYEFAQLVVRINHIETKVFPVICLSRLC
jgi:hypothetical protein